MDYVYVCNECGSDVEVEVDELETLGKLADYYLLAELEERLEDSTKIRNMLQAMLNGERWELHLSLQERKRHRLIFNNPADYLYFITETGQLQFKY